MWNPIEAAPKDTIILAFIRGVGDTLKETIMPNFNPVDPQSLSAHRSLNTAPRSTPCANTVWVPPLSGSSSSFAFERGAFTLPVDPVKAGRDIRLRIDLLPTLK